MVSFFHKQGTQIAVHAHGERAIDQVIEAYDKLIRLSGFEGTLQQPLSYWILESKGKEILSTGSEME